MKVNNKFLNFIFNKFDFPIRFIYCRLGPISRFLYRIMFWKLYSSNFNTLDRKFQEMHIFLKQNNIDIRDKVVLELGPGNSYINAYNFLLHGAKKVIRVDKFPRHIKTARQKKFYEGEIRFIKNRYSIKELFFLDRNNKIKEGFIKFINKDLTNIENLKVDFIYSLSVLEHIKKIKENIIKMGKILKVGGYMYHSIDMRDHYNFNDPFLFYKYSDFVWDSFLTKEGLSYTNRWRYADFIKEFKNNKLKIIKERKKEYNLSNTNVYKKFQNYSNLNIGVLEIFLEKWK